jgi:hypothetical protein
LREAGFKFKSYWAIPSYNYPRFSARLDDRIGLKGFVQFIGGHLIRFKRTFSIIEKFDSRFLSFCANALAPSFLFYCYKNEIQESIDDIVTNAAQLRSYFTAGYDRNIRYVLCNRDGTPSESARVKRYLDEIPKVIPHYNKEVPSAKQPQETIWFEGWVPGRRLNPSSIEEAMLAIEWLFDFQNKTKTTIMTQEDISLEIAEIRKGLSNLPIPSCNTANIKRWLDDYQILSQKLNIVKAAQHGDFHYMNILFDPKTKELHVIDWEYYKENSNPLYDFVCFVIRAMESPNGSIEDFRNNLSGTTQFSPVLGALIARAKEHFGAEFDLSILMPYVFLRQVSIFLLQVSTKALEQKQHLQSNNVMLYEWGFENVAKRLRLLLSSSSSVNLIKS